MPTLPFTSMSTRFIAALSTLLSAIPSATAQVFNGGGVDAGLGAAEGVVGVSSDDPRQVIIRVLEAVLNYAALFAVIMIIAAGFYMVLSFGSDDKKEKAKKIVYYTVIGLIVILFSRIIVSLVTVWLPSQV